MNEREQQEAEAFIRWRDLSLARWPELKWLFHIPNGGKRHVVVARKLKAAGLRKGVVDYFLPSPPSPVSVRAFRGLWLEMKTEDDGSALSAEQVEFLSDMAAAGYAVAVARGWEAAARIVENYLRGKHENESLARPAKDRARNRDLLGDRMRGFGQKLRSRSSAH